MDAILILVGTLLIIFGAKKRDEWGHRTGGGIAMVTSGIVVTSIGATIFTITFLMGYFMAQIGAIK